MLQPGSGFLREGPLEERGTGCWRWGPASELLRLRRGGAARDPVGWEQPPRAQLLPRLQAMRTYCGAERGARPAGSGTEAGSLSPAPPPRLPGLGSPGWRDVMSLTWVSEEHFPRREVAVEMACGPELGAHSHLGRRFALCRYSRPVGASRARASVPSEPVSQALSPPPRPLRGGWRETRRELKGF